MLAFSGHDDRQVVELSSWHLRGGIREEVERLASNKLDLGGNTERALVNYALDLASCGRELELLHRVRLGASR